MNYQFLVYIISSGTVVAPLAFIIYKRKMMHFAELHREGIRSENKGNFAEAMDIYRLLLEAIGRCLKTGNLCRRWNSASKHSGDDWFPGKGMGE